MTDILRLFVSCTDKGQHPLARLGELNLVGDQLMTGLEWRRLPVQKPSDRPAVWWDDRDGGRAQMRCPRCGRHVQWRGDRAREVIRAFNRAGITTIDISHHP
jgi:hypothetical protein